MLFSPTFPCFSLIYQLPDKILRWIGVQGESTDAGAVEQAKGSMDKSVQEGSKAVQDFGSGQIKQGKQNLKDAQEQQSKSNAGDAVSGEGAPPGGAPPGGAPPG